jgi:hypothetical protein
MPLTTAAEADELVGGASAKQVSVDPIAARVLLRGEPTRVPVGRADDFSWPRRAVLPLGTDPVVATSTTPITPMTPYTETRQAAATPGAASAPAPRPGPAPTRQAAVGPRPTPGYAYQQQQQQQRRLAPAPQPFFFPFFGGR